MPDDAGSPTPAGNAPDEYLSDNPTPLPPGYKTPEALVHYENFIPTAVRRVALRANYRVRGLAAAKRKHRTTGRRKGPCIDDTALARDVYKLIQEYRLSPIEAGRRLAQALASAENVTEKAAWARVRRALRRLG